MLAFLRVAIVVVAVLIGFVITRRFVLTRLRFVDAVRSPAAPWIVGILGAVITYPIGLLPLVTHITTALFGVGAGLGTASGAKALKRGDG